MAKRTKRENTRRRERVSLWPKFTGWLATASSHGTRVLVIILVIVAIPLSSYVLYRHTTQASYFRVTKITISGNQRLTEEQLKRYMGNRMTRNIFEFTEKELEIRIRRNPWVREAWVKKTLPDSLDVRISEHKVRGLVVLGAVYLLNENGEVFKPLDPGEYFDFPLITGIGHQGGISPDDRNIILDALEFIELYDNIGLGDFDQLSEVHYHPLHGFTVFTKKWKTEIRIGKGRFEERLKLLVMIYRELVAKKIQAEYILLDSDRELTRVAIKPLSPQSELRVLSGVQ